MRVSKELLLCVSLHPQRDRIMKATARQNGSRLRWDQMRNRTVARLLRRSADSDPRKVHHQPS